MWVARDKNIKYCNDNATSHLWLYLDNKPIRCPREYDPDLADADYTGCWLGKNSSKIPLDDSLFPELRWEDEPIEVELTIKEK